MRSVSVIGAGGWGTALAVHLAGVGHNVRLWGRDRAIVDAIATRRVNDVYLPGVTVPATVSVSHDVAEALCDSELVVAAVPSGNVMAPPATRTRPSGSRLADGTPRRMFRFPVALNVPVAGEARPDSASDAL